MKYKVGDRFEVKKGDEHDFYFEDIGNKITILKTEYANEENHQTNHYKVNNEDWLNEEELDCHYTKIENPLDSVWDDTPIVWDDAPSEQVGGNHYSKLAIQPYEYSIKNELNCYQFNVVKYVTRYKNKNGIEDLKKAIQTLEKLIEYEESITKTK